MPIQITTVEEAHLVLKEVARRASSVPTVNPDPKLIDDNFPKQAAAIRDPAKFKAWKCTRRAGKTTGGGIALFEPIIAKPNETQFKPGNTAFFGLTQDSAMKIIWKDVLLDLDRRHKLGAHPVKSERVLYLPNGSAIYVEGADATKYEMEKFLGRKYRRVLIDESASFRQDLKRIVYEMLWPTTIDEGGDIIMMGTTGKVCGGFFYEVTENGYPGWSVHEWSALDNPYIREQFQKEIDELTATNPNVVNEPWFKRMILNEWVPDTDNLVYKYNRQRNWIPELPRGRYHYMLVCDPGFTDASAFTIYAFPEDSRKCYIIYSKKQAGLDLTGVANRTRHLERDYRFFKYLIDGADKQAVEEMRNRMGIPWEPTDKRAKVDFIHLMNHDLERGNVVLVGDAVKELEDEWVKLPWDEEAKAKGKLVEDPRAENHCADTALYGWRYNYVYLGSDPPPPKTEEEKMDEMMELEGERLMSEEHKPFWERLKSC